jgi:hypothetical protein
MMRMRFSLIGRALALVAIVVIVLLYVMRS